MRTNPENRTEFAAQLANDANRPLVDVEHSWHHASEHDTVSRLLSSSTHLRTTIQSAHISKHVSLKRTWRMRHKSPTQFLAARCSHAVVAHKLQTCARRRAFCSECVKSQSLLLRLLNILYLPIGLRPLLGSCRYKASTGMLRGSQC